MKVIHLISGGDSGGAKTHVLSLLSELNKSITAQLVCFRDGPFAEEARSMGIPTEIMGGNDLFRVCSRLRDYIKQGGYSVIHCHGSRANMVGALLRKSTGVPVVTTVHSDYRLDYLGRPLSRLTFGTINTIALRCLDYRIGVSDAMVDLLISRGFAPDRFFAIYNGIDFTPPDDFGDRLPYLRSLGADVDEDSVVIGIAARLNPVKDMSTLIRGFARAYESCPRLRLVIAGDGAELEKLQSLARECGVAHAVTFAGWISGNMDRFYSALDINVLTSISETFPYALTEGTRHHLATVATAVGGIPSLIDHEVNGYLITPGDDASLGKALASLGNNDKLRLTMGEKLYEKASREFSIAKTVETQKRIYEEILRRSNREKRARDGVVICGAYGRGNAGDDAILQAILRELKSLDPDLPVTVLSKNPKETRLQFRVRALSRVSVLRWCRAMHHASLYINGGGSLIQDVTSRRSLWFYLFNIFMAKKLGCPVQMYGCGIGPVTRVRHEHISAAVLNRNVDLITLREPDSLEELQRMGVTKPEIRLTADPALILPPANDAEIDSILLRAGIPVDGAYLCFTLRLWPGFESACPVIARCAEYAYARYGLIPLFAAIETHQDPVAARMVTDKLHCPYYLLDNPGSAGTMIGMLSRMQAVVSMRLHALIFAAGQGVPLVGLVYDPKVSSFLRYIGQEDFADLDALNEEKLRSMIDHALARRGDPQAQAEAVQKLKTLEAGNARAASELLGLA